MNNKLITGALVRHSVKLCNSFNHDIKKKGKGHPCTGTEALYRPYGP